MKKYVLLAGGLLVLSLYNNCAPMGSTHLSSKDLGSNGGGGPGPSTFTPGAAAERDLFKSMPQGAASLAALCGMNTGSDKFTQVFCGANPPTITSLASLHAALGLTNAANTACTTASGSISKAETSVLTPRCIRFSLPGLDPNAVAIAYLRSAKTMVEIVSRDANQGMRFYLLKFDLPCEATNSCTPADYMKLSAESNWQNVSFYEDKQLKNTIMDCTSCHQPGGVNTEKRLLMVETQDPWSHWFHKNRPCGKTLLDDFNAAHTSSGRYADMSITEVNNSDPNRLQAFVENNGFFGVQFGNNIYDSNQILYETGLSSGQPVSNANTGTSATWQNLFNQRVTGANRLRFGGTALPYHDCKQSDPSKLQSMIANYVGVVNGSVPSSAAQNLAHVNLSTPEALAKRFLTPVLGPKTAQQILANACLSCHNSSLDQSISRARFNAEDLSRNSAAVYGSARARIKRGHEDLYVMPPGNFMTLNADEIATLDAFFASQGGQ